MSLRNNLKRLLEISECFVKFPGQSLRVLRDLPFVCRGFNYSRHWGPNTHEATQPAPAGAEVTSPPLNTLKDFFDSHDTGRGIWKWDHYFDIYHRHFKKFVGTRVNVLEIGVYGGGSLEMWRHFFGPKCRVYGVDIDERCKAYENEYTEIIVGDQEDRNFWKLFRERVPAVDILIDDGAHKGPHQMVTLEEMLPHIRPGGVFLCEDLHGEFRAFSAFMQGFTKNLHAFRGTAGELGVSATELQAWIRGVHVYPYVIVIEKAATPVRQLISEKRGSEWPRLS